MKIKTVTEHRRGLLVAGALALCSQGAMSGEANAAKSEPEVLTVTAPRPHEIRNTRIESDISASIEAVNRRIREDLEQSLEAIGKPRIELVISEVPTRG